MVGETWDTWRHSVARTIEYEPDSVTIYQMELPFNTVYSKGVLRGEGGVEFASWSQKRDWHDYAIEQLEAAGYEISSAYTMLKPSRRPRPRFVYADAVWHGSDMVGAGVSAFSHVGGVHFQNVDRWDDYLARATGRGAADLARLRHHAGRAADPRDDAADEARAHRARLLPRKFGVDVVERFAEPLDKLESQELLAIGDGRDPPHPRRPAAGGSAFAGVLRARLPGLALYLRSWDAVGGDCGNGRAG